MKEIDGVEVLKEMLKIEKKKWDFEKKINENDLFLQEVFINYDYDIFEVMKKILKCKEDTHIPISLDFNEAQEIIESSDFVCNDWLIDSLYDYFDGKIELEKLIEILLKEEE